VWRYRRQLGEVAMTPSVGQLRLTGTDIGARIIHLPHN